MKWMHRTFMLAEHVYVQCWYLSCNVTTRGKEAAPILNQGKPSGYFILIMCVGFISSVKGAIL